MGKDDAEKPKTDFVNHKQLFQNLVTVLTAGLQDNELNDLASDLHAEGRIQEYAAIYGHMTRSLELAKTLAASLPAEN